MKSRSGLFSILIVTYAVLWSRPAQAILGLEIGPMLQLVAGQVKEIEHLTEQVGIAKENRDLLIALNRGIDRTVDQIQSIQTIVERAQGLDPSAIRSISDLNEFLSRVREARRSMDELMGIRLEAARVAIAQSALQGETAYVMGQEMIVTGGSLARESEQASPGRAQQIAAASGSAQMLGSGVGLQTLAQIAQLQAMQLELQRAQLESTLEERRQSRAFFERELSAQRSGKGARTPKPNRGLM